jgi:hypothetical protein
VELDGLSREDRLHVTHADHLFGVFDSAEYAVSRCPLRPRNQLLALVREPSRDDVRGLELPGFEFKGFELIEEQTETSALTNCGGFPRAFAPEDLSESGLITDLDRAYAVRSKLRQEHPDEDHADCAVWAIWRQNAVRT